ncbi:MAG: hypothetical protein Q7W13_08195 [Bacteroidia bacterium]|nr:hypothetical protein [Bacteroidia bacterium]
MPGYYIASRTEVPESNKKDCNEPDGSGICNNAIFINVSLNNKSSLPIHLNNQYVPSEEKSTRSDMPIKTLKLKYLILNKKAALKTLQARIIKNKVVEKRDRISIHVPNLKQPDNTETKPIRKWQMLLLFCVVGLLLAFLGWGITGLLTALLILGSVVVLAFLILILILGSIGDSAWG